MIVADDHGWNDLGCYGHPVVRTPHLDRLAAEGVRLDRCFTTAPLCSPGRSAVLTGLYPHTNGVTQLVQGPAADALSLDPSIWTLAQGFSAMGYETAAARKWHLSTAGATAHGFAQEFPDRGNYLSQSLEFLREKRDKPWFLYFCPNHTHRPFRRHPAFPYQPDAVGESLPPYLKNTPDVREHYARYLSETSQMDSEIGELLQEIEAAGALDNTIVAYCTDHGPSMHRAKFSLYEWGTHSAAIFRGPGISGAGRVDDGLASTIDVAPTLMSLAGGAPPQALQGIDFSECLAGKSSAQRQYVFSEHHQSNHMRAVRDRRFKLIRNITTHTPLLSPRIVRNWQNMGEDTLRRPYPLPRPREEFFDLDRDPLETTNLAADPRFEAPLGRLRSELERWWSDGLEAAAARRAR